jgi:phospholysine phosphohistidine inorganic pyrophosphate phosphatase
MKIEARGVLFDLDGTIYEGSRLIAGAAESLDYCRRLGIPFRFVTNTTSKPRSQIVSKLDQFGVSVGEDEIFTAPAAARSILINRGFTRCHFLLHPSLMSDMRGVENVDQNPQAVVIGDIGEEFSFVRLNRAFRLLLNPECAFITLARNRFFKVNDGLNLDSGAFVAALEFATGRESELIGKPATSFYHAVVASMGLPPANVVMIGDDIESDALGAKAAGLQGVLVRTGKFRPDTVSTAKETPDAIWDSIADLPDALG